MRRFFQAIIMVLCCQLLISCTQYRYEYVPPQDEAGIACTRSCMNSKWDCSNNCESNYSRCMSGNGGINININSFGQAQPQQDRSSTCSWDKSSCMSNCGKFYNDCYRSCGGIVNVYEIN